MSNNNNFTPLEQVSLLLINLRMNKGKNETQYLKEREVAGYVDYRNHLLFFGRM
ncbi:MAG: hypothetical protein WBZ36_19620 [Candidatus Nitrosopolaris sp.]|jgi:hypothetical protein